MTRGEYRAIAQAIKDTPSVEVMQRMYRVALVNHLCALFAERDLRFSPTVFRKNSLNGGKL